MGGGPDSHGIGRVYGLDGAVRLPPIYKLGAEPICCNLTSSAPDDRRIRPKYVELRIHQ